MRLYFIRHGQSANNQAGQWTGQQDVTLTDKGREQASALGKHIVSDGIKIDLIVASPLIRAYETAQLVADELGYPRKKIVSEPLVMERFFGELEGKSKEETGKLTEKLISASGAESDQTIYDRAEKFIESVKKTGATNVLVVSHNGFGKRFLKVLKDLPADDVWGFPDFPNAELVDLGEI